MTSPTQQRGVTMLLFAVVLILGFAAVLYARLGKWGDGTTATRNVNAQALKQAKEALIGFGCGLAYIALKGRRGGSALAAAAVNALVAGTPR